MTLSTRLGHAGRTTNWRTTSRRKTNRPGEVGTEGVERDGEVWRIRSMPLARAALRAAGTRQAGFSAEAVSSTEGVKPLLYLDGETHRAQRSVVARYFAPVTVNRKYLALMESYADEVVSRVVALNRVDVSAMSLAYSVAVAAEVVGLTDSVRPGMPERLVGFFSIPAVTAVRDARGSLLDKAKMLLGAASGQAHLARFYWYDVRPAIAARRTEPRDDVVSHCLSRGLSPMQILIECIMYGAAGMVTTREFLAISLWHFLENPDLRAAYLAAERDERLEILHELLRVEPVVGHLYRRTTQPLTLEHEGEHHEIPAGALLDLHVRATNADPDVVGADPLAVCPGRELPKGVGGEVLAFGDGAHKCPGNSLAIAETDVLLTRLLKLPLRLDSSPRVEWLDLIEGYEVRDLFMVVDN